MKRQKRPVFICFVGMDGSGKTTLAENLVELMNRRGMETRYVWNRFEPWIIKPFIEIGKALFLKRKKVLVNYTQYSDTRKKLLQNPIIGTVYEYLLMVDYFWQILVRVQIPLIRQKNIVSDRYVYDTLVDLTVDRAYPYKKSRAMLRSFLCLYPKPDMIFLIDLPEEMAYLRKRDVPSVSYLKERRQIYLDMGKECGMTLLDGSMEPAKLQTMIWNIVKEVN